MTADLKQNHMCKIMNQEPGLKEKTVPLVAQRLFGEDFPVQKKSKRAAGHLSFGGGNRVRYSVRKQKQKTRVLF